MEGEWLLEQTSCMVCKDLAWPVDLSGNTRKRWVDCIYWLAAPAGEAPASMKLKGPCWMVQGDTLEGHTQSPESRLKQRSQVFEVQCFQAPGSPLPGSFKFLVYRNE